MEPRQIPFSPPDISEEEIEEVADTSGPDGSLLDQRRKSLKKKLQTFVILKKLYV